MNHQNPSVLPSYNSLADKHLAGYFSNTRIRRHLVKVGLITRGGTIVPDKEYKHRLMRREHQRHMRECLAQAIFHKVLDIERHHQVQIKRKLEDFAQKERVNKIKVDRSKRYEEDLVALHSPRPPSCPRNGHAQHSGPEAEQSESSDSLGSSRPNTAPGNMQRPIRLKPISSSSTTHRPPCSTKPKACLEDSEQLISNALDKQMMRPGPMGKFSSGISPYRLPVINNYVTPVPPLPRGKEGSYKGPPNGSVRGRKLRPTTAPDVPLVMKGSRFLKVPMQSNVTVMMTYYGKSVRLSHDDVDLKDEVKVFQQHCGGENVCVYKGRLVEGEAFQFVSRRHRGFPFSLTFFLNGMQVDRLSSCCEFRHRRGSRLGGKQGHFGFTGVEGASPCYRCIIAMGLDKKPTPPPKRVKEDTDTPWRNPLGMSKKTKNTMDEDSDREGQCQVRPESSQGEAEDNYENTEEKAKRWDKSKDDYEEDFEADDERADEEEDENEGSPRVKKSDDDDDFKEEKSQETVANGKDLNSDSEVEEDQNREKKSSPLSSRSSSPSGNTEDTESDTEEVKETIAERADQGSKAELREEVSTDPDPEEHIQVHEKEQDSAAEDMETTPNPPTSPTEEGGLANEEDPRSATESARLEESLTCSQTDMEESTPQEKGSLSPPVEGIEGAGQERGE